MRKKGRICFRLLALLLLTAAAAELPGCGRKAKDMKNTDAASVSAEYRIDSIVLEPEDGGIALCVGETFSGRVCVLGEGSDLFKVVYLTASDRTVAALFLNNDTHDSETDFTVTGLKEGETYVYAMSNSGVRSNRIKVTVTEPSDTTTAPPAGSAGISETEPDVQTYILNTNTGRFHYPWCPSVKKMKNKNKKEVEDTRENVIAGGYVPCGNCRP